MINSNSNDAWEKDARSNLLRAKADSYAASERYNFFHTKLSRVVLERQKIERRHGELIDSQVKVRPNSTEELAHYTRQITEAENEISVLKKFESELEALVIESSEKARLQSSLATKMEKIAIERGLITKKEMSA